MFGGELAEKAYQELGGLDTLALVAGKQQAVDDISDLATEQIYQTFEVNVFSLYWLKRFIA
jgi:NADP-dependent 3-hydroxy acid dehydrogenase YdfG